MRILCDTVHLFVNAISSDLHLFSVATVVPTKSGSDVVLCLQLLS